MADNLVQYEVETHPFFAELGEKQKVFVRHYVETGDALKAVAAAYGEDVRRPQAIAARLLRFEKIRDLLQIKDEVPPPPLTKAALTRLLSQEIRNAQGTARFVPLVKLFKELLEIKPGKKEEKKEFSIDDIVLQMEKENGSQNT